MRNMHNTIIFFLYGTIGYTKNIIKAGGKDVLYKVVLYLGYFILSGVKLNIH